VPRVERRGEIEVYGSMPLVGAPLNMTVDEDQRFWWTDVFTKGLGSIEPLSGDPESTIRCIDLPDGSLPMQPRAGPDGAIWYTNAGRNGFGRIEASAHNPASTLEFFTTDGMPPLLGWPHWAQIVGSGLAAVKQASLAASIRHTATLVRA